MFPVTCIYPSYFLLLKDCRGEDSRRHLCHWVIGACLGQFKFTDCKGEGSSRGGIKDVDFLMGKA